MAALRTHWRLRHERPRFVTVSVLGLGFFPAYAFPDWHLRTDGVAPGYEYYD